jgi:hypothetical protein
VTNAPAVAYTGTMKLVAPVLGTAAAAVVLAGCGSGTKPRATPGTAAPTTTIAGVGFEPSDNPPGPSTPTACLRRWNGAANASGRTAAEQRLPKVDGALIRRARSRGYFGDYAGRCLVYLIKLPNTAVVFVEASRGMFRFTADASGRFPANADLGPDGRLQLR